MLNHYAVLTPLDTRRARLTWTPDNQDLPVTVFVNGQVMAAGLTGEGASRSLEFPLADDEICRVEVHEGSEEFAPVQFGDIFARPNIHWDALVVAEEYRLYHTAPCGSEKRLRNYFPREAAEDYLVSSPLELIDGWHFFRVEAVDKYGHESNRLSWWWRVYRPPQYMPSLFIAGMNHNFTLFLGSPSGLLELIDDDGNQLVDDAGNILVEI